MPVPLHMPVSRGKIMPEKGGGRIDESGMEEGEHIYIHYAFYREFGCTWSIAENDGIDRENCAWIYPGSRDRKIESGRVFVGKFYAGKIGLYA